MTTQERIEFAIKKGMTYDAITGNIYGISGKLIIGKNNNYIRINIIINKKQYCFLGHQFAWFYTYGKMPEHQIDHINRDRCDNRIDNLRDISQHKNNWNQTGNKGCTFMGKKWRAYIHLNKKKIYLDKFDTFEEAHQAYLDAKKIYHII